MFLSISIPHCSLPPKPPHPRTHPPIPTHHVPLRLSKTTLHLPKATSLSGSAADFPEQLVGKRRRSVAGVDQDDLVDPAELADPDSSFLDLNGVKIHHKITHHREIEDAQTSIGLPIILLHGFGASVFSWDRVMKPLARVTGSKVVAFDRPAFGLTSRVEPPAMALNPYSMAFSVMATVNFINMLGAGKAILMGRIKMRVGVSRHSAGCLVAVNAYFEAPEKVAALILVAPAIFAPLVRKKGEKGDGVGEDNRKEDGDAKISSQENLFVRILKGLSMLFKFVVGKVLQIVRGMLTLVLRSVLAVVLIVRIWKGLSKLCKFITVKVLQIVRGMRDMVGSLYTKALTVVLRSALAVMLVRMVFDKFGTLAIQNAWYDASQLTDHVIKGYTKPLRAKGWEKALLEYTIAMLTDSASKSVPPLGKRLADITCPVLIVTGDTDRLVPFWNAERLSRAIPGSTFEVIRNCGHLPHEEKVEEFLTVIERFLQRVFGAQEGQISQATS